MRPLTLGFLLGLLLTACQPQSAQVAPTFPPFPTMTPGQALVGVLPLDSVRPQIESGDLSNPATAAALANRPTPTPNLSRCPLVTGGGTLAPKPTNPDEAHRAIADYLQAGGTLTGLQRALRNEWNAIPTSGYWREEVDLTGEGTPELVIGYTAPPKVGALLVLGCYEGVYQIRYTLLDETSPDPPTLIWLGDMNNAPPAELVVARPLCVVAESCDYETFVLAWDSARGRFINLLDSALVTLKPPQVRDIDGDDVAEIVVELKERGTAATGPLRTGVNIYDWNGSQYTLSIVQLDPPRYLVQVVHEGDKLFSQLEMERAVAAYTLALSGELDLRYWFNDEPNTLVPYTLYRTMLALAYLGDVRFGDVLLEIQQRFPIADTPAEDIPTFALMAYRFAAALQAVQDLHAACVETLKVLEERPNALTLLNRYGRRSPTYAPLDLCPF